MKDRPLRTFAVSTVVVLAVYLLGYSVLIKRVVVRSPYASGSEQHFTLTPVPTFRGVSGQTGNRILYTIYQPLIRLDCDLIRPKFWERSWSRT